MLDTASNTELRDLIELYDTYIQESVKSNQCKYGWRPVSVETFFRKHYKLLKYLDSVEEDSAGVMFCEDYIISHLGMGQLTDFCEGCSYFPDNCLGELPVNKLRNLLKQYEED